MNTSFLKNTFFSLALLVSTAAVFTACQPEDGNIGPKGTQGETGPAGPGGDRGHNGTLLYRNGFVTGTVRGMGRDGVTPYNETFRYEFSGENTPFLIIAEDEYYFNVLLKDSLANGFQHLVFSTPSDFSSARFRAGDLKFYKKVSDSHYKHLRGKMEVLDPTAENPGTITNFKYNSVTGVATGDYSWGGDNYAETNSLGYYRSSSSTNQPFTVTGSFSFVARMGIY